MGKKQNNKQTLTRERQMSNIKLTIKMSNLNINGLNVNKMD